MRSRACLVVLTLASLSLPVVVPPASAAVCETSSPPSAGFTVTVCLTAPGADDAVTGDVPVQATVSVSTSKAIQSVKVLVGTTYAITDLVAPYRVVLPTDRWPNGSRAIAAAATFKVGGKVWTSKKVSVPVTFANATTRTADPFEVYEPPGDASDTYVVAAVGDGAAGRNQSQTVTDRIATWNADLFLYLGDVYSQGTYSEFTNWYGDGTTYFSRFREITDPAPGNHEYEADLAATGYMDYWGAPPHFYAFDVGAWHVVSLDSTSEYGQVEPGTAQFDWLAAELAATGECTLVYFHHPAFAAGTPASTRLSHLWALLAEQGVDVVLVGHEHNYQRWRPLDADREPDAAGPTEVIVGTGGMPLYSLRSVPADVASSNAKKWGALRLELSPGNADLRFIGAGGALLDTTNVHCSPAVDHAAPTAPVLQVEATATDAAALTWSAATDDIGVTGYRIHRDDAVIASVGSATLAYGDTGLAPDTDYLYVVEALDAAGHATPSDPVTAHTPATALLALTAARSG